MKILVTGAAGFIGSNFCRYYLAAHPEDSIIVLDKLTYAGRRENLSKLESSPGPPRFTFIQGDICDAEAVEKAVEGCEGIVHFAAETMVDRSIQDADDFLRTNVLGTRVLLETVRRKEIGRFLQISTDEVYGSLEEGEADEEAPLRAANPYSASKAGADLLVLAYVNTHHIPALVVRSSNNYGPFQHPEKFIPIAITNLILGKPIPIYGRGVNVRDWLYVGDNCRGIDAVFQAGAVGEVYNLGTGVERTNIEVARRILSIMGAGEDALRYVDDRPGHDLRYAVQTDKVRELGWAPEKEFEEGLRETADWYRENETWWAKVRDAEFEKYYKKQYKGKID